MTSRIREMERKSTIFTVWFSLWDLWYHSNKTRAEAQKAIEKTVDILFEQLNEVAAHWKGEVKVVMPEAIDPTFLPGWMATRTGPNGKDKTGDEQRNAVRLAEQWNDALDSKARNWDKGQLYIYNTNEWLLDQVREQQLVAGEMSDHNGLGAVGTPWENVLVGCLGAVSKQNNSSGSAQASEGLGRCAEPDRYLFWLVGDSGATTSLC